jgi:chromosome segregation ATPase
MRRQTTWIVLTGGLLAAVIGLAIWVAVLQSNKDETTAASASRIDELEQANADLEQQVADLEQRLEDEQAAAEAAAAQAQSELEAAREQYESIAADLGAKGQDLDDSRAELERLGEEADAALAEAEEAAGSARARARAHRARADHAEACLAAVADVLERLFAADDPAEGLDQAADELEAIAEDCSAD